MWLMDNMKEYGWIDDDGIEYIQDNEECWIEMIE